MKNIYLLGGGGHCRSCIDVIESTNLYRIGGIFDTSVNANEMVGAYKYLGDDNELNKWITADDSALVCIGHIKSYVRRQELYNDLVRIGCDIPTVVSPHAYVGRHVEIGAGTIVMHGVVVNVGVSIGSNSIINSQALLEHDVTVGEHSHVSTGAIVNGGVTIGSGTFIGSGTVLHQGITIGSSCVVAAGSVVTESLEDYGWYPRRTDS